MKNTRVLLVEDERLLLNEILELIDNASGLEVFQTATTLKEARTHLHGSYDLLVVDKQLPDGSGIDLIQELSETTHHKKILMMTVFDDEASVLSAIAAGADGYFVKQDAHLVDAMCAVMYDQNPISPTVGHHFMKRLKRRVESPVALSNREQHTLQALADGLKYHQIADRLAVSRNTVPDYIKSLYRKLGVHDRASAVYVGLQKGLIELSDQPRQTVSMS